MSETLDAINALAEEQHQLYSELCGAFSMAAVLRLRAIERKLALLWERRREERAGLAEEVLREWEGWGKWRPRRFPAV